jgi:hypothetical protein
VYTRVFHFSRKHFDYVNQASTRLQYSCFRSSWLVLVLFYTFHIDNTPGELSLLFIPREPLSYGLLELLFPPKMSEPGDFDHLCGTVVEFKDPDPHQSHRWRLLGILTWSYERFTREGLRKIQGASYSVLKFSCETADATAEKATMRIYVQSPLIGTGNAPATTRRLQAIPLHTHREETTLEVFDRKQYRLVP